MSKSDLVIFMCSNSIVMIAISIIFMIIYTSFVISKMKKIKYVSNECSNIILHNKIALEDDEKTCYSINKYNKATLELLKEIRNVLTAHKGKYFDTQLLNIVEIELQQKLNNEKYKDLDYYNTSENNTIKNNKCEEKLNLNLYSLDNKSKKSRKFKIKIKKPLFSLISTTNKAIKKYLNSFKNKQAIKINNYQNKKDEKLLNLSKEITLKDLEQKENIVDNKYVKSCSELKQMYNYDDDIFNLEELYLNLGKLDKSS